MLASARRIELRLQAEREAAAGRRAEAAALYRKAAEFARAVAEEQSTMREMNRWFKIAEEDVRCAADMTARRAPSASTRPSSGPESNGGGFEDAIDAMIRTPAQVRVTFDDIAGHEQVKSDMLAAYALAIARTPPGIHVVPPKHALLYGPPGGGKTLIAAAIAATMDALLYEVSVSSIMSKWFGESSQKLAAVFEHARGRAAQQGAAFIFVDEIHSLCREDAEHGAEQRLLGTLLAEMDGLSGKSSEPNVFVVGATNHPGLIHAAVLSRFSARYMIGLPGPAERESILRLQIDKRGFSLDDVTAGGLSYAYLVDGTRDYSGRDLARLCRAALLEMFRRANPGLADTARRGAAALRELELRVLPLCRQDFDVAFRKARVDVERVRAMAAEAEAFATSN